MTHITSYRIEELCDLIKNNEALLNTLSEYVSRVTIDDIYEQVGVLEGLSDYSFSFLGDCYMKVGDPREFVLSLDEYERNFGFWLRISKVRSEFEKAFEESEDTESVYNEYAELFKDEILRTFMSDIEYIDSSFDNLDSNGFKEIVEAYADIVFEDYYEFNGRIVKVTSVNAK